MVSDPSKYFAAIKSSRAYFPLGIILCDEKITLLLMSMKESSANLFYCNVNEVNRALVGLLQQVQGSQVVPLQQKIHLHTVIQQQVRLLCQHRGIGRQRFVNSLLRFLKDQAALPAVHIVLQL